MVSSSTIVSIMISLIIAIGAPTTLLIIFKRKLNISIKVFLFGMLTFFLFAQVLEALVHSYFLVGNSSTKKLLENPWIYMLYGGLMAGIFEETGRFVMMKYALKKFRRWKDGLSFGIGHGGIEAFLLVGMNSFLMLVFAFMINNGTFDSLMTNGQTETAMAPIKEQLTGSSSYVFLLSGIERLSALSIHIALSILVLYAIRNRKIIFFFLAILIHAVFNFPAALYQAGVLENIIVVELIIAVMAVGAIVWIVKSRNLFSEKNPPAS